ncbi:MAG TPA: S41 family peptidase [Caulobacteraceae bacterium]|nr:S41 family peptidase [Caulobacteraceae bacterium]
MNRLLGIGLCLLLAGATGAAAQPRPATDYAALYDRLTATVAENFYDPTLYGVDWKAAAARHRPRAAAARSDAEFLQAGRALLGEIKSSHLDLRAPTGTVTGGTGIGARLVAIDGVQTVTEVVEVSDAHRRGLRPGDQILNEAAVNGARGSTADLRVRGCDGKVRSLSVRRETVFWPPVQPSFRWRVIDGGSGRKVGYLRIDAFEDDGAPLADRAMADMAKTDALIIDVRANSGGNASALRLASYFTREAAPAVILLARPYLAALGRPLTPTDALRAPRVDGAYTSDKVFEAISGNGGGAALWTEDLGEKRYTRPVYVLQGEETASAAEGFTWVMRLSTRAVIVGRPSAGALLSAERFDLGQGWSMRIPTAGIWAPDGENYGDRSVPAHVEVKWSRADLCAGRDADVVKALEMIEGDGGR